MSYLTHCFSERENQIKEGPGGAGIGLFMTYNSLSSLIVNVSPYQATEVIGLYKLNQEAFNEQPARSFCYFQSESVCDHLKSSLSLCFNAGEEPQND
jgi:hypothetical protein